MEKILKATLRLLARWTIAKYNPGIIGITGTVGKTSTKEAVFTVIRSIRSVRASSGNFNNEIGLPLTILGNWQKLPVTPGARKFFWLRVVFLSLWRLIFRVSYPELLILEYAAGRPGDIRYLLEIAKPQISIVTAIGDIPVHVEYYSGPDEVAREKSRLVEFLPAAGFAVLNSDDEAVLNMKERTRAHIVTYGFAENAEVRVTHLENRLEKNRPAGIVFKMEYGGSFVPVRLNDCFGKAQGYAAAAAAAVGLAFGMNLVKIAEALGYYQAPPGRFKIVPGVKDTFIFDDSYNASPLSMHAAIDTLKSFRGPRKVAVLGDMLEIGKYTVEAHEAIGALAGKVFDVLITVGPRSKFIAEQANKAGLAKRNIFSFETAEEATDKAQEVIRKGDYVLVKASRSIGLEKIVEEIRSV